MPKYFTVRDLPKTDLSAEALAKAGRPREKLEKWEYWECDKCYFAND